MAKRNWKRVQPTSLIHALRLCKDYAKDVNSRSVERIADLIGVTDDLLYKWLASGKLPAILIPPYENACGIDFVSRWLAVSNNNLVISIPTGRDVTATDVHQLQAVLNEAAGGIIAFASGDAEAVDVLSSIGQAMNALAWHHGNIKKHVQPELGFGGDE